jgi:opacity protein-like surface antigen
MVSHLLERALIAGVILCAGAARADGYLETRHQLSTLVSVSWEAAFPQGSTRDFIDKTSFRGGQLELGFGVASRLSLGVSASWNWVAQSRAMGSLDLPGGAISGPAYRRAQLLGALATAHWYLRGGAVQPYLGAGLGGGWHGTHVAVASIVRTESGWHWAGEPRVGVLVAVRPGLAVNLQARYAFTTARLGDAKDARWLAVDVGLAVY